MDREKPAPASGQTPLPKWAQALIQSGLVALFLGFSFLGVSLLKEPVVVSCLAASAFIAFGFPSANSARPRVLLGGYLCGAAAGVACSLLLRHGVRPGPGTPASVLVFCALAAFFTAFFMILLSVQHPPAAAFAVGVVLDVHPFRISLIALGSILVLCLLQRLTVRYLGRFFPPTPPGQGQ